MSYMVQIVAYICLVISASFQRTVEIKWDNKKIKISHVVFTFPICTKHLFIDKK